MPQPKNSKRVQSPPPKLAGKKPTKSANKPPVRGASKPKNDQPSGNDELNAQLVLLIKAHAEECGIGCDDFGHQPGEEGEQAHTVGGPRDWDGHRLKNLFDFIVKIAPIIIPFVLSEKPAVQGVRSHLAAESGFDVAGEATPLMGAFSLSFSDIEGMAKHVVNLLESQAENAKEIAAGILKFIRAVSGRKMFDVFAALVQVEGDVEELVTAIKTEFSLE